MTSRIHPVVEPPVAIEFLIPEEHGLDAIWLRVLPQLAQPAGVIPLAVKLEQQLAGHRRAVRLVPIVVSHRRIVVDEPEVAHGERSGAVRALRR